MQVLFVCSGNTCRSSMAEALLRKMLGGDKEQSSSITVSSAGTGALPGDPASENAIRAMQAEGIDLTGHRATRLDRQMVLESDLVLTMTSRHKEAVLGIVPEAGGRVFTLKEFIGGVTNPGSEANPGRGSPPGKGQDGDLPGENLDIADPFGGSLEIYLRVAGELKALLQKSLPRITAWRAQTGSAGGGLPLKVVIGSDHGGFQLKNEIVQLLVELQVNYQDLGVFTQESSDYPDIAARVARAVAAGEFDRGILLCGTGIGVSIAANKVRGIRAALCHDTYSARMAMEHNNSNILTMGGRVIGPDLAKEIVKAWLETSFSSAERHARRVSKIAALEGSN